MGALEIHNRQLQNPRQGKHTLQCNANLREPIEWKRGGGKWGKGAVPGEVAQYFGCILICLVPHRFISWKIAGVNQMF